MMMLNNNFLFPLIFVRSCACIIASNLSLCSLLSHLPSLPSPGPELLWMAECEEWPHWCTPIMCSHCLACHHHLSNIPYSANYCPVPGQQYLFRDTQAQLHLHRGLFAMLYQLSYFPSSLGLDLLMLPFRESAQSGWCISGLIMYDKEKVCPIEQELFWG